MCGIVGYIGGKQAQPILLNCLARMEYRGYDSCGIAVNGSGVRVCKDVKRVQELAADMPSIGGTAGIGHTRWATHGEPSLANAHPHLDCSGNIAVVHNGVIHNYQQLRQGLIAEGHSFASETDTEVISHLVEKYYNGDLEAAVGRALKDVDGSYAVIVLAANQPGLVVARKESPLVIGIGDRETFIASDVPAILDYTNRAMYLEDGDIGIITKDGIKIRSGGAEVARQEHRVLWSLEDAQKGGYEHFMLKEIHEQPAVIRDTLGDYTKRNEPAMLMDADIESLLILACGTSYHAGLVGKYIMENLLDIPVRVELASEFNYWTLPLAKTVAIAITQSGETADTLKAMKKLKDAGCTVVAITNVVGSSASRIASQTICTRAGPEISVAATKSFTAQLMVLYWLAMSYRKADPRRLAGMLEGIRQLPKKVQQVLDNKDEIVECARRLVGYDNAFFIGRGLNFPTALEGALKLKEISYIHAEGCAAGELKHGPFALLGKDVAVVAVVARDDTYDVMLTNIKEVKTRGAPVIALAEEGDRDIGQLADLVIPVPKGDPLFSPVVNSVALQLLAYYAAKFRGCPIDTPKNLAKSVTVE